MKKYIIVMRLGGKCSYVLTRKDYKHGGYVDINARDFSIATKSEARFIKHKLETYARYNNDFKTEFSIEQFKTYEYESIQ